MKKYLILIAMAAILVAMGVAHSAAKPEKTRMSERGQGKPLPQAYLFNVNSINGQQVALNNLRGKVVIIDFFATWCPPCQESVPHLLSLQRKYGKSGLQVIGLSVEDTTESLKTFAYEHGVTYPLAVAPDSVKRAYRVRSIPHLFVVNKRGEIADVQLGYDDEVGRRLEELINRLLKEK